MGLLDALNSFFSTKEALNLSSLLSCGNCWYSGYNVKGKCTRKNPPQPILTASQANLCDAFTVEAPQTTTTARLDVLAAKTDMVKGAVDAVEVVTAPLSAKLDTLATKTDAVKASADLIKTATDESKASIEAMNTDVKGKLDLVKTSTDTIQTKTDLVKAAVDTSNTKLDSLKTSTDLVKASADLIQSKVDTMNTDVKGKLDLVKTSTDTIQTKTDLVKAAVDASKTAIDQTKSAVQALPTPIRTINLPMQSRGGDNTEVWNTITAWQLVKTVFFSGIVGALNITTAYFSAWNPNHPTFTCSIKFTLEQNNSGTEQTLAELELTTTAEKFYYLTFTPPIEAHLLKFRVYLGNGTGSGRTKHFQLFGDNKQAVVYT